MEFADTETGPRCTATPGARGSCPICHEPVLARCGQINIWHWAHISGADCDPWAEHETPWHRTWKQLVPPHQREVVIGAHRADIVATNGTVVELQHSSISVDEVKAREQHYGRMMWVFDAAEAYKNERLSVVRRLPTHVTFRWKHPRKTVAHCRRRTAFLDLGGGWLLRVNTMHTDAPCYGSGQFSTVESCAQWMNMPVSLAP